MNSSEGSSVTRRATLLQWLVDAPGRLSHWLTPRRPPLPPSTLNLTDIAGMVRDSPRSNGVLSLEQGLRIYGDSDAALTWAGSARTAFACGGVHGSRTVPMLREFTNALRESGYRRALLFPIDQGERADCLEGGFPSVRVGMEALLRKDTFHLQGKSFVDLRQMLNRAKKRYQLDVWEVDPSTGVEDLHAVYQRWLLQKPTWTPMALVVGSPSFDTPLGRRYFAVGDRHDRRAKAFISLGPGWQGRGWGLDVMARDPDAPAGAMEFLITRAASQVFDEGAEHFSLGAAPLYAGPHPALKPAHQLERIMGWIFASRIAKRFFHFKALARFKMKFSPTWTPVYIGIWPRPSIRALYGGCRMWGLFGQAHQDPSPRRLS